MHSVTTRIKDIKMERPQEEIIMVDVSVHKEEAELLSEENIRASSKNDSKGI